MGALRAEGISRFLSRTLLKGVAGVGFFPSSGICPVGGSLWPSSLSAAAGCEGLGSWEAMGRFNWMGLEAALLPFFFRTPGNYSELGTSHWVRYAYRSPPLASYVLRTWD